VDYLALSDVLREQLLLYMAYVGFCLDDYLPISLTPIPAEFNDYNAALFTIRARALNNFVYWIAQIIGSVFIGYFVLDNRFFRRKVRAYFGWITVFVMVFIVHTWAYFYQK